MAKRQTWCQMRTFPGKRHAPIMFTTDLSLKVDPEYRKIAKRFHEDPEEFELAFAKAWFKLTHRDMGPRARYIVDTSPDTHYCGKIRYQQ